MWRLRPTVWWGAAWTWLSLRRVRRRLQRSGLNDLRIRPTSCPPSGALGVQAVLSRLAPTCLERALVLQAWLAVRGDARDVVIGVPPGGMGAGKDPAHAWLDGLESVPDGAYVELHRVPSSATTAVRSSR